MIYFCCEARRRALVRQHSTLNGIDYLEVVDHEEPDLGQRQRVLRVYFVKQDAVTLLGVLQSLTPANVRITGGQRTTGIVADALELVYQDAAQTKLDHLRVHVTPRGDFSTYTLQLVAANTDPLQATDAAGEPLLDPVLNRVDFSFKVECSTPFDCRPQSSCPPPPAPQPEIDYLAKDYASFRQLILDRLAVLVPDWRERNPADLGITLVELLAYVGDYLSYRQDAIASEAYLGTARSRVSVRRHARLLDYPMHDGCNARAWVQVRLKPEAPSDGVPLPRLFIKQGGSWQRAGEEPVPEADIQTRRTRFLTRTSGPAAIRQADFVRLVEAGTVAVFEPMRDAVLYPDHNEFRFHAWGDEHCCLPAGAVKATLQGHHPHLDPGDVLVFVERLGPATGLEADADPERRHAVRLVRVNGKVLTSEGTIDTQHEVVDPTDPLTKEPITEIEWAAGDALPFPFCISTETEQGVRVDHVSVARGNIVLADHGLTVLQAEPLGAVPEPNAALAAVLSAGCSCDASSESQPAPSRFRPCLQRGPVTQIAALTRAPLVSGRRRRLAFDPQGPAATVFDGELDHALPAIRLGDDRGGLWLPQADLLSSDGFAPEFVLEAENDGRACIRFGDDVNGMRPGAGTRFFAVYRVGNGPAGNVGAEAIRHVVLGNDDDPDESVLAATTQWIADVSNPLAARGGRPAESLEEVRQYAPAALRTNRRAVTPDDYARFAEQHPDVQRAAARLRWTGSWHTVFLAVDRRGGRPVDEPFEDELRGHLEPYRMAGHDLEIDGPRFVPLELKMTVCVHPEYFRGDVLSALRDVLSSGRRADRSLGFFHPDRFTFGQPVLLSQIYAAAQAVEGVRHVEVTALQRQGEQRDSVPADGQFHVDRLEIIRLDDDPNFPDRGQLQLTMKGGR